MKSRGCPVVWILMEGARRNRLAKNCSQILRSFPSNVRASTRRKCRSTHTDIFWLFTHSKLKKPRNGCLLQSRSRIPRRKCLLRFFGTAWPCQGFAAPLRGGIMNPRRDSNRPLDSCIPRLRLTGRTLFNPLHRSAPSNQRARRAEERSVPVPRFRAAAARIRDVPAVPRAAFLHCPPRRRHLK